MAPQHRPGRTGPGREPGVPAVAALEDYGRPSETSTKAEALERARVKTSEVSRSRPPKAKEEEQRRPVTSSRPARTPSPSKFGEGASPVGEVEENSFEATKGRDYGCLAEILPEGWDPERAVSKLTDPATRK